MYLEKKNKSLAKHPSGKILLKRNQGLFGITVGEIVVKSPYEVHIYIYIYIYIYYPREEIGAEDVVGRHGLRDLLSRLVCVSYMCLLIVPII